MVWVRSCLVVLVPTCPGFVIWGGINAPTVSPQNLWNHVIINALGQYVGVSSGASGWILEASVLYHCFYQAIHPWILPRLDRGVGKRSVVTSGDLLDCGGNFGELAPLTRKTRPGASSNFIPDPGHSTPRRWKRLRLLSSEGEGGEVGVPRNLFPRLGVG